MKSFDGAVQQLGWGLGQECTSATGMFCALDISRFTARGISEVDRAASSSGSQCCKDSFKAATLSASSPVQHRHESSKHSRTTSGKSAMESTPLGEGGSSSSSSMILSIIAYMQPLPWMGKCIQFVGADTLKIDGTIENYPVPPGAEQAVART